MMDTQLLSILPTFYEVQDILGATHSILQGEMLSRLAWQFGLAPPNYTPCRPYRYFWIVTETHDTAGHPAIVHVWRPHLHLAEAYEAFQRLRDYGWETTITHTIPEEDGARHLNISATTPAWKKSYRWGSSLTLPAPPWEEAYALLYCAVMARAQQGAECYTP